jgi:hypothetical protein
VALRSVLGIDLASAAWASNGTAAIRFSPERGGLFEAALGVIEWPGGKVTAPALASAIDDYARANRVCCVALDGPHAWRDPETPAALPGVGRRSEYACRTQGKTGVYPNTYPRNQRAWIELCIDVFSALLDEPGVVLQETIGAVDTGGYGIIEAYPTAVWRASGLSPLPSKAKKPVLAPAAKALANAFGMRPFEPTSHDDLQAVAAALCAVGAAGGPVQATALGVPCKTAPAEGQDRALRLEGYIWQAQPLAAV